ncbi:hypothetical protein TURU_085823 [Turdus rufiventris]|nr:hypothetical protein TURU_085823 [Turdus rufiventris]
MLPCEHPRSAGHSTSTSTSMWQLPDALQGLRRSPAIPRIAAVRTPGFVEYSNDILKFTMDLRSQATLSSWTSLLQSLTPEKSAGIVNPPMPAAGIGGTARNGTRQLPAKAKIQIYGLDGIHSRIPKVLAEVLIKPLSIIYHQSWFTSEVPDVWKLANVMPNYKKYRKENPET